ncbi:hypothetical protein IC619_001495 [Hazenella sp. IB182353]|uniref:glycosyl hydrolase family 28-related protein n=1 Tax=Polycladospora coralii TaxID=2771432 RepID=UPI001745D1A9|nr:glycosyl hydrolase family 28-related protein [Polycladospora coralii]MBS7529168.1 hypothetical protein [Polycladospora coralii]
MLKVNVKEPPYHARGDGETDDTHPLQRAIKDVLAAGGGVVYIPAGTYFVSASLELGSNCSVVGAGVDHTIIDLKHHNRVIAFDLPQPPITGLIQTEDIQVGDQSNPIENQLLSGDFIVYRNHKRFTEEWDGGAAIRGYYKSGELFKIKHAETGLLQFEERASLDLPYTSVAGVDGFTPYRHVVISHMTIKRNGEKKSGREVTHNISIRIQFCDGAHVHNIKSIHTNYAGLKIDRCMNIKVNQFESIGYSETDGLLYGVLIADANKYITLKKIYSRRNRHGVCGGNSGYGVPMYVTADGVYISETTPNPSGQDTHALDCHGASMCFVYRNCVLDKGMSISGMGHRVENVISKSGVFMMYEGGSDMTFSHITYHQCKGFYSKSALKRINYQFVHLNFYQYSRNQIAEGSSHLHFSHIRFINQKLEKADKLDGIGLQLRHGYSIRDSYIEGFWQGLYVNGENCFVENMKLVNCGWKSLLSKYACALRLSGLASHSYINGVEIHFIHQKLTLGSPLRLDYLKQGEATSIWFARIKQIKHRYSSNSESPYAHPKFNQIFMYDCYLYPDPSQKWKASGKYVEVNFTHKLKPQ